MGESPQELRRDIENIRGNLGTTLDEIGDRVSPRRIVRRRTARIGDGFRSARVAVMGNADTVTYTTGSATSGAVGSAQHMVGEVADQARQTPDAVRRQTQGNPLAAGLIAFGGGLLLAAMLPATDSERQAASKLQDVAQPVRDKAVEASRQVQSNLQDAAQDALQQVKGTARDAAHEVADQAGSSARDVGQHAQDAARQVRDRSGGS